MVHHYIHKPLPHPTTIQPYTVKVSKKVGTQETSFSDHLKNASSHTGKLKISKHAGMRMNEREIAIEPHVWNQIGEKVNEAKQKGVNDSLVLLKNAAMIISAKNNTVVTVMDRQEAEEQIFTNIDGTIVMG